MVKTHICNAGRPGLVPAPEDPVVKEMATSCLVFLPGKITRTEEPWKQAVDGDTQNQHESNVLAAETPADLDMATD